jgi:hypothetical protein
MVTYSIGEAKKAEQREAIKRVGGLWEKPKATLVPREGPAGEERGESMK